MTAGTVVSFSRPLFGFAMKKEFNVYRSCRPVSGTAIIYIFVPITFCSVKLNIVSEALERFLKVDRLVLLVQRISRGQTRP